MIVTLTLSGVLLTVGPGALDNLLSLRLLLIQTEKCLHAAKGRAQQRKRVQHQFMTTKAKTNVSRKVRSVGSGRRMTFISSKSINQSIENVELESDRLTRLCWFGLLRVNRTKVFSQATRRSPLTGQQATAMGRSDRGISMISICTPPLTDAPRNRWPNKRTPTRAFSSACWGCKPTSPH